jgi:saccharopepsin
MRRVINQLHACSYAPVDICAAIYGNISGAYLDDDLSQWVVPCDAEVDVALQFE